MSIGDKAVGGYKVFTAGQALNIRPSQGGAPQSGALLGFLATTAGTCSIYDDPATGTATPIVSGATLALGWNPLPFAFATGCYIVLTTAAGTACFI